MEKSRLKLTLDNSPESKDFLDFFKAWSNIIPTVYFLDICCIGNIKNKEKYIDESERFRNKYDSLKLMEEIDLPHNAISCLPAMMEKVSDRFNDKTRDELKEEVERDLKALNGFFKKARVIEQVEFTDSYVEEMKDVHPEAVGESYHNFLLYVNSLGLSNTLPPAKRLGVAKQVIEKANELGVDKFSAVVVTALACIYGCNPAKKVMKFKDDQDKFNSSNALADIQTINRIGKLSKEIESRSRSGQAGYVRAIFLTDDDNLKKLYDCFFVNNVIKEETETGVDHKIKVTIEGCLLFPDLFDYKDAEDEVKKQNEYTELLKFMGVPV
ncbi:hypothetical protein [Pantoea ananatis]|uniref:hypothetical protein n=1 Tax=Pantoea ananas TaxID=553 RepID=UPI001B304AC7|nr:hypothetical protein [Pantoea ananatis]